MKSHERLKAEARVEDELLTAMYSHGWVDGKDVYRNPSGDFQITVLAHYLGTRSKRLTEPVVD